MYLLLYIGLYSLKACYVCVCLCYPGVIQLSRISLFLLGSLQPHQKSPFQFLFIADECNFLAVEFCPADNWYCLLINFFYHIEFRNPAVILLQEVKTKRIFNPLCTGTEPIGKALYGFVSCEQ